MAVTALPTRENELLAFSANFNSKASATPTVFGLTAAQMTAYSATHAAFAAALTAATDPTTRTKAKVAAKNDKMRLLRDQLGMLCKIVMAQLSVTNEQRIDLGLPGRAIPQPIPAPATSPGIEIVSVVGRTIRVRLYDAASPSKRGKPEGVVAATVFSCVSETDPTSPSQFRFEGSSTRLSFDIVMNQTVAPGSKVYVTAMWTNPRMQSGPACAPISTHVQFGGGMNMAA